MPQKRYPKGHPKGGQFMPKGGHGYSRSERAFARVYATKTSDAKKRKKAEAIAASAKPKRKRGVYGRLTTRDLVANIHRAFK